MSGFKDISIIKMDDSATQSEPGTKMLNVVLTLSESTPTGWADYFNQAWKHHFCMVKRTANISGNRLEIYCTLPEIQGLIPELNKVIGETNRAWAAHVVAEQDKAEVRAARSAAERDAISDVAKNLKFD